MLHFEDKSFYAAGFFVLLALLLYLLGSCASLNHCLGLPDDNPIEEAVEGFIEYETGLEIDLTP